jgi:hypothetical protein
MGQRFTASERRLHALEGTAKAAKRTSRPGRERAFAPPAGKLPLRSPTAALESVRRAGALGQKPLLTVCSLAPQPERPVRQCPPRFAAGGRRKAQVVLHSCGQKRDRLVRPVGYHAYPLRSSSL